jgi:hypothetical protein
MGIIHRLVRGKKNPDEIVEIINQQGKIEFCNFNPHRALFKKRYDGEHNKNESRAEIEIESFGGVTSIYQLIRPNVNRKNRQRA